MMQIREMYFYDYSTRKKGYWNIMLITIKKPIGKIIFKGEYEQIYIRGKFVGQSDNCSTVSKLIDRYLLNVIADNQITSEVKRLSN